MNVVVTLGTAALVSGLILAGCATSSTVSEQSEGDLAAGRAYAVRTCAQCHNVTVRNPRPLGIFGAPDFYAVANAKTTSGLGLTVFLTTPHPTMPNLIIAPEDRRNVIAYILSLRRARKPDATGV
jgi:mono/diheme cytochrome c family protein